MENITKKVSTRERILEAALELFSEKGYDGVGVDLIAAKVGMKGPSLYKHFKGKEDILNSLIDMINAYYEMNFGSANRMGKIPATKEELIEMSLGRIMFTMHDERIKKVRRILTIEQFRNPKIAKLASLHNLEGLQLMFSKMFSGMMEEGNMKKDDPDYVALIYVSPISLLIQTCDREPEREDELMGKMMDFLRHFADEYVLS